MDDEIDNFKSTESIRHRAIKKFLIIVMQKGTREKEGRSSNKNATFFVHMEKWLSDVMANYKMEL